MKRRWSFFSCSCWAWSYSVSDMGFFLTFFFCLHNRHMMQMQMQFFQRARLPVSTPVLFEWFLNSGILDHAWSWNSKAAKVIFFYIFYWSFCVTRTVEHIVRVNRGVDYQSISFERIGQFFSWWYWLWDLAVIVS